MNAELTFQKFIISAWGPCWEVCGRFTAYMVQQVCCCVLQWVLRCVADWCRVVQCGAVLYILVQHIIVWCSVVQCGAVWCSVVQYGAA